MKIGFIGAMQIEMDNLQKSMTGVTKTETSGVTFYEGHLAGRDDIDIVAAVCGIGKVFAAICASTLIQQFNVDMVINIGDLKEGNENAVLEEIRTLKSVCGDHVLKVIVETCLLTEEEKKTMCRLVTEAGADYIKTSTGFSTAGATFEDVALFDENVGEKVKIKAAGGISSFADGEKFLELGADRLGTSRLVKLMKEENA